jgi:hypothetical protein
MKHRKWMTAAAVGAVYLSSLARAAPAGAATVCNEAENSARGGYSVSGGIVDPVPPAFLRGSQMRVGNGGSAGLTHAADMSPALRQCGTPPPPPPPPPPTDGGGDTGGTTGGDTGGGDTGPPPILT